MAGPMVRHPDGRVEPAIRKLTQAEHESFANAIAAAVMLLPAYRDSLALMRPFYDATAQTAYIDKYSRVGLSPWFFSLNVPQRASAVLHECSHVLHNCFIRGEILGAKPMLNNVASDLEINSGLNTVPNVDLSFGILPAKEPYNFPDFKTQEQYYHMLQEAGLHQDPPPGPPCPQHGNGNDDDNDDDENSGNGEDEGENGEGGESEEGGPGEESEGEDGSGGESDEDGSGEGESEGEGSGSSDGSGDGSEGGSGSGQPDPNQSNGGGKSNEPCTCPHDDGQGGGSGSGSGSGKDNTKSCDEPTQERQDAADEAGVDRASDAEQSIAKKNTMARMTEEAQKARQAGTGELANFYELALERMRPPKVHWSQIFRRLISRLDQNIVRGRSNYSYRRVSRRITDTPFIFPGMVKYTPKAMIAIDTSGSMGDADFMVTLQEIEGIMKAASSVRDNLSVFCVDTTMKDVQPVKSIRDINLKGGGGTDMAPAWEYVTAMPAKVRPDIMILASDCFVPWEPVIEQLLLSKGKYTSIILSTTSGGYQTIPPEVHALATVLDISDEGN